MKIDDEYKAQLAVDMLVQENLPVDRIDGELIEAYMRTLSFSLELHRQAILEAFRPILEKIILYLGVDR